MLKSRKLLSEIPSGKFHSVIFTTYSINLYYLEQQVLPLLGSKDIHYVSILADGHMLSTQLGLYSKLSQTSKRNYSIHGIQSHGAFHPKLIFLVGPNSILLLIGSGNLTTSGHGKNLEVWSPVYVESPDDSRLGFVLRGWDFLKTLHLGLGSAAKNTIQSIEENCILLSESLRDDSAKTFKIDKSTEISFISDVHEKSMFSQLTEIVSNQKIHRITIMSPYYDVKGQLIHALNDFFKPKEVDIIIQEDFGALPHKMNPKKNMRFFDWSDVQKEEVKQLFFHAKNIILEGNGINYLISGSANASIAAFGSLGEPGANHEVCILYQSKSVNFKKLLGIDFRSGKVSLSDYDGYSGNEEDLYPGHHLPVFIKSVEKHYDEVSLLLNSKKAIGDAIIHFYDSEGVQQFEKVLNLSKRESSIQVSVPGDITLMYAEFSANSLKISNKQFVIDVKAYEGTNPSPKNRSLNQIRKMIESGIFSTTKIIDYLNTVYKQKESLRASSSSGSEKDNRDQAIYPEQESDILYMSYEEIQRRADKIIDTQKPQHYVEYRGVRLLDSIFSYLKEGRALEVQERIDEEETEDINNSGGRDEKQKPAEKKPASKAAFERFKKKVDDFLYSYWEILRSKVDNHAEDKPDLRDLSMFLIVMEILLHLLTHKEKVEGTEEEDYLMPIGFNHLTVSVSEYIISLLGLFTLWHSRKGGFLNVPGLEYEHKLKQYQEMAFQTSVSALALFCIKNPNYDQKKIITWRNLGLLNAKLAFNADVSAFRDVDSFLDFIPANAREDITETVILDQISDCLSFLKGFKDKKHLYLSTGSYFHHPEDGYTYVRKVIYNRKDPTIEYCKLIGIGYYWDEKLCDFWNGSVYNLKEGKWYSAISH